MTVFILIDTEESLIMGVYSTFHRARHDAEHVFHLLRGEYEIRERTVQ